eukprot:Gregarina_sp_Poly_1__4810@NODE_2564_length_1976_cov_288_512834_g1630_i0_p1_GENE_NODE_2564_length_1976_cov_288_512834_g1630_i0NODE_2564_length_1976_cov_288_512834_g1630_i0_p1_ORF_typecomplete_len529_score42_41Aminotran_1_2/PF00155_21/2_7e55Aminotran_MocR/PF12897_7/0_0049DegT_DnrJ_EryC1/PF01041_17/0_12Aminotran_3/PF00202_21/0_16Beta_elim_lyase/PF01212_21/0_15_NODE_2564_length_1976_cov_288_512834_g1630_i03891936
MSEPHLPAWVCDKSVFGPEGVISSRNILPVVHAQITEAQRHVQAGDRPYKRLYLWHLGNPHEAGVPPSDFLSNMVTCISHEMFLTMPKEEVSRLFPVDVVDRCRLLRKSIPTMTGYSHSLGLSICRQAVAHGINKRDLVTDCNPDDIFLSNGGIEAFDSCIRGVLDRDTAGAILLPMPHFMIWNSIVMNCGGTPINYVMCEERDWRFGVPELEAALHEASFRRVRVKGLVVINPSNPTGMILDQSSMEQIVEWCVAHDIVLIADEVYQENVFSEKAVFHSFSKIKKSLKSPVSLLSLHSASKGWAGCCGLRGGYCHVEVDHDPDLRSRVFAQRYNSLGPNTLGQVVMACIMTPPKRGDPSYPSFVTHVSNLKKSLNVKARLIAENLNKIPGISCAPIHGCMFAYPRLHLPQLFVQECENAGVPPDCIYSRLLLDSTGICVIPGCVVGELPGTYHVRFHILDSLENYLEALDFWQSFHVTFLGAWQQSKLSPETSFEFKSALETLDPSTGLASVSV